MSEHQAGRAAASEWAAGWPPVLVGVAGMALVNIPVLSMGLLLAPQQDELGWTRTEASSGYLVSSLVALFALPLVGKLVDRFGARRVALPGTLLTGVTFALLGLTSASLVQWWIMWAVFSLAFAATNPAIWTAAVSRHFVAGRGLAIGVMMSGSAVAGVTIPHLTRWSIDSFGWRSAYPVVGGVYALITFLLVLFLLREAGGPAGQSGSGHGGGVSGEGPEFGEAMRDPNVIKILVATSLIMVVSVSIMVHFIPMVSEKGIGRIEATAIASSIGVSSLAGKLLIGWLADRVNSRIMPALCYALPALTCVLLLNLDSSAPVALVAVAGAGFASGSVLQLSAYLLTRYAGLRCFGRVCGLLAGLMGVAGGLGPLIASLAYDRAGNYDMLLMGNAVVSLLVGVLIATLSAFPVFVEEDRHGDPHAVPAG